MEGEGPNFGTRVGIGLAPALGLSQPDAFLLCPHPIFLRHTITLMASDCLLPGQPVPLPKGPAPLLGSGIYSKDGLARASVVGVPHYDASVCYLSLPPFLSSSCVSNRGATITD